MAFCPLEKENLGGAAPEEVINWESKLVSKISCRLEQCFDTWEEVGRVWGEQEAGRGWEGEVSQRVRGVKRKARPSKKCSLRHDLAETGSSVKGPYVLLDLLLNGELCPSSPAVSEQWKPGISNKIWSTCSTCAWQPSSVYSFLNEMKLNELLLDQTALNYDR